jgi:hypothetical protein
VAVQDPAVAFVPTIRGTTDEVARAQPSAAVTAAAVRSGDAAEPVEVELVDGAVADSVIAGVITGPDRGDDAASPADCTVSADRTAVSALAVLEAVPSGVDGLVAEAAADCVVWLETVTDCGAVPEPTRATDCVVAFALRATAVTESVTGEAAEPMDG